MWCFVVLPEVRMSECDFFRLTLLNASVTTLRSYFQNKLLTIDNRDKKLFIDFHYINENVNAYYCI